MRRLTILGHTKWNLMPAWTLADRQKMPRMDSRRRTAGYVPSSLVTLLSYRVKKGKRESNASIWRPSWTLCGCSSHAAQVASAAVLRHSWCSNEPCSQTSSSATIQSRGITTRARQNTKKLGITGNSPGTMLRHGPKSLVY